MASYYASERWRAFYPKNFIVAKSTSDLENLPDNAEVHVNGTVVIPDGGIELPSGGIKFVGIGPLSFLLGTQNDQVMFKSKTGEQTGIFWCEGIVFQMTGTNSKMMEYEGADPFTGALFSSIVFRDCVFFGINDLGDINNPYIVELLNITFNAIGNGFKFDGNVRTSIISDRVGTVNLGSTCILFRKGDNLTINNRFETNIATDFPSGTSGVCDFEPANILNDGGFQVKDARLKRNGLIDNSDVNYFPNISQTDRKSDWSSNTGIPNTHPLGQWKVTTEATTTVTTNTPAKLAGTTTNSSLVHFTTTGTNQGMSYANANTAQCRASCEGQIRGGNGDEIRVQLRVNKGGLGLTYVDYYSDLRPIQNYPQADDRMNFRIEDIIELEDGDIPELWGTNTTDSTNITITQGSGMIVEVLK